MMVLLSENFITSISTSKGIFLCPEALVDHLHCLLFAVGTYTASKPFKVVISCRIFVRARVIAGFGREELERAPASKLDARWRAFEM